MPKEYQKIYGYFDFENVYEEAVRRFPKDSNFLEIGVWLGKSACFMAELLKETNSNNKFYCLDHFFGEINATDQQKIVSDNKGSVYNLFLENMKPVEGFYIPIKDFSQNAAYKFQNESFDFIFLDAEHSYGCVMNDLNTWYPKLKKAGVFAGHDYRGEVKQAVDEFFGQKGKEVKQLGSSFIVF
jgi:hypothetical protein